MNLCSDGHEEVCYECRKCPACEEKVRADDAEKRIVELEARIEELNESRDECNMGLVR